MDVSGFVMRMRDKMTNDATNQAEGETKAPKDETKATSSETLAWKKRAEAAQAQVDKAEEQTRHLTAENRSLTKTIGKLREAFGQMYEAMKPLFEDPLQTHAASTEYDSWLDQLSGKAKEILMVMIEKRSLRKGQIALLVHTTPGNGHFNNEIRRLVRVGLLKKTGDEYMLQEMP